MKEVTRWVIKADGKVVGYEYSLKKANRFAGDYAEKVHWQDDPWFPKMTVEKETISDE